MKKFTISTLFMKSLKKNVLLGILLLAIFCNMGFSTSECSICQDTSIFMVKTPCHPRQHSFCFQCINQWFKEQHQCPLCRQNIPNPEFNLPFYTLDFQNNLVHQFIAYKILNENPELPASVREHIYSTLPENEKVVLQAFESNEFDLNDNPVANCPPFVLNLKNSSVCKIKFLNNPTDQTINVAKISDSNNFNSADYVSRPYFLFTSKKTLQIYKKNNMFSNILRYLLNHFNPFCTLTNLDVSLHVYPNAKKIDMWTNENRNPLLIQSFSNVQKIQFDRILFNNTPQFQFMSNHNSQPQPKKFFYFGKLQHRLWGQLKFTIMSILYKMFLGAVACSEDESKAVKNCTNAISPELMF